MDRVFFTMAAGLGGLGVALGAFGAHALASRLAPADLDTYELAVRYQFIHSLALVATAVAVARWPSNAALASGWLFAIGIVLFSGSLYAMALIGAKGLAAATPIGGLLLIAGWAALAVAAWRGG